MKKIIINVSLILVLFFAAIIVVYYKNINSDMVDNSKNVEIKPIQLDNALLNTDNAPAWYKKLWWNTTTITNSWTTIIPKDKIIEFWNFE